MRGKQPEAGEVSQRHVVVHHHEVGAPGLKGPRPPGPPCSWARTRHPVTGSTPCGSRSTPREEQSRNSVELLRSLGEQRDSWAPSLRSAAVSMAKCGGRGHRGARRFLLALGRSSLGDERGDSGDGAEHGIAESSSLERRIAVMLPLAAAFAGTVTAGLLPRWQGWRSSPARGKRGLSSSPASRRSCRPRPRLSLTLGTSRRRG